VDSQAEFEQDFVLMMKFMLLCCMMNLHLSSLLVEFGSAYQILFFLMIYLLLAIEYYDDLTMVFLSLA
jgi:hypothetical protein